MKIPVNSFKVPIQSFTNALSTKQEKQYLKLMQKIDEIQKENPQDEIRVVKIYTPALPSSPLTDTGIGKPSSPEALRFYEMAKVYGGATAIKHMPMGQLTDKGSLDFQYAGAYQRSGLSYGEEAIDLSQLASKEYGFILPSSEITKFRKAHLANNKNRKQIDFKTTLGWTNQQDYPINNPLKVAFENFKTKKANKELKALRAEFNAFKNQKEPVNYDEIYTRLALFPYIKDWATAKTDFFVGFDSNPEVKAQKIPEYNALKEKYKDEIEFFKFKQFLAHKSIQKSINMQHSLGLDAIIDCPIGFSWVEEQVFPDAFLKDQWGRAAEVGWGIHAINYPDLIQKEDSAAHQLLKSKISHCLNLYDGIRFDVGWSFMNPCYHFGDKQMIRMNAGTKITDFIEQIARNIKGENFDQRKLMYECDASGADFNLWENKEKLFEVKGMAILSTEEEKNDSANIGWGNLSFIKENIGLLDDDFILGTNNHDKEGVLNCAFDPKKSSEHVGALQRVFNVRPQDGHYLGWTNFKDDENLQEHIRKYTRGRFAEIDKAKHSFILYTDMLGTRDKVDYHCSDNEKDYKVRLDRDFEKKFHQALQNNAALNLADVKCLRMELNGNNVKYPELYEEAKKYSEYLKHNGGIYTREQANNSNYADVDISKLSFDEIKHINIIG